MTEQTFTATIKAHRERQEAIHADLLRLISEAKEIARQLAQLNADRMNAQNTKETVQHA